MTMSASGNIIQPYLHRDVQRNSDLLVQNWQTNYHCAC